jgi:hypothetical protein
MALFREVSMKVASSVLAWTMVSGIVLACGDSSSDAAKGPARVTDQTLEAIAGSFCDRIATCYGDIFVQAFIGDTATCKSRLETEVKASARGAGVQLKEAEALTCKAAVDAAACNTLLADGVKECDFRGTLADGAACASDSQCTSGACFVDAKTTCGKCGLRAAEGADCTSSRCARGLTCSAANKCLKTVPEGGACDANTPCEVSLSCIGAKCGKGLANGAACKNAANERPCDGFTGLFCKPPSATVADGTCTPFSVATANQLCGITLRPAVDYAICKNSQCVGATSTTRGTCKSFLEDGAACDATKQPDCQFPAKCRNGKCALLDPTICK